MRAYPIFLLLFTFACNPKVEPDTGQASGDTDADSDANAGCEVDAEVSVQNGTEDTINRLWVCTPESCASFLDGIGTLPGDIWRTDACSGPELVLAVVDLDQRCAVSDRFSLGDGGSYLWEVDAMTGVWQDENTFGCVAD